jgi:hypothetical protein
LIQPVTSQMWWEIDVLKGLSLWHDHCTNTMSGDFQDEIALLGIESSPSFRQPEGNGVAAVGAVLRPSAP